LAAEAACGRGATRLLYKSEDADRHAFVTSLRLRRQVLSRRFHQTRLNQILAESFPWLDRISAPVHIGLHQHAVKNAVAANAAGSERVLFAKRARSSTLWMRTS